MKLNYADFHELSIMRERIMTISDEVYNSNPPFSFRMALDKYSNELENIKVRCEEIFTKTDQKEVINFLLCMLHVTCNMSYKVRDYIIVDLFSALNTLRILI